MNMLHVSVPKYIATMLQCFNHIHILCHMEVWDAEVGPAGPAEPAPMALYI